MTITKHDGVAILPKRCDVCNRLFWLEPYNTFYETVGIEHYSIKQIKCKECVCKEKNAQRNYNKLLETIEEQIQRDFAYAEHETGEKRVRREGIANGLQVAARMIKGFYEEGTSGTNTRG